MRAPVLVTALLAVATSAAPVHAEEPLGNQPAPRFGENAPRNYESSQRFALEIKFGPYSPNIDKSPGLTKLGGHPFLDLFPNAPGKSRPPGRLLTQVELDYQFLRKSWGTLAIGHTIGYYRRNSHALKYEDPLNQPPVPCAPISSCKVSGDSTSLNIVPLSLLLVYRFDLLARRWKIPFVPYFKGGLAYYMWWIENGSGFLSFASYFDPDTKTTDKAYGGTWGYVLNPGGAFLLDIIDPAAAKTLDAELGINHTYLFCELHYADITGFGASNKMNLSDLTLNAGISFEF